jgi:hypothetical protein
LRVQLLLSLGQHLSMQAGTPSCKFTIATGNFHPCTAVPSEVTPPPNTHVCHTPAVGMRAAPPHVQQLLPLAQPL